MTIAILKYRTQNIGDEIQSLAMERLLPRVDLRVDRDDLAPAREWGDDVRFILQGWFGATMRHWPPVTGARTLWVSVHCPEPEYVPPAVQVGCRDPWSLSLCEQRGMESWLSYCVSLSLQKPDVPRDDSVLLVDVPDSILERLPPDIAAGQRLTHLVADDCDRRAEALARLDRYARARWVVTSRIHAFLPCVAMGTPVVFLRQPSNERRYLGHRHLAWPLESAPWDRPRPRVEPEVIHHMMVPLRDAVQRFVES